MPVLLSPSAKQQFFTNAGVPAAGYALYTYAANTTTPQATYTNRAGSVSNANPIILDSRGEAIIYLTPGIVYDYVLKTAPDPGGSTIWTREDVIADAGDANAVNFIQAGAGAVSRDSQSKMRERVSVLDFGATGDGSTDDTAAIQTAMDSFASVGYGDLYFPKGVYKISSALVASFNGRIRGDGVASSVIRTTSTTAAAIRVPYSGFMEITGLDFATSVTKVSGAAISMEGFGGLAGQQTRIHHNRITGYYYGIDMANSGYWSITENGIFESVQAGIRVDNTDNYDAGDNLISGNVIQKTALTAGTSGILHVASGGTKVIGNKILGHDRGYSLTPRSGAISVIDTQLVGNSIEDGNIAVYIQTSVAGTSVGQMVISSNQMSNKANGIILQGAASGVVISGNQIACNFTSHIGIYLDSLNGSPSQVVVADNQISGNSSASTIGIYGGNLANVHLNDNQITGMASPYSTVANTVIRGFDLTFALLPTAGNGSYGYCSNGTVANPVAGAGTGCFAKRLNGVWVGN